MYFIKERHFVVLFLLSFSPEYHYANMLEVRFCGLEQSCSHNITKHEFSNDICCRPCECDDICAEKGTCCPDKNGLIDTEIDTKQKCLLSVSLPNDTSKPGRILSYYNRVNCPKTFNDEDIKRKCEGENFKTVSSIIPVSSHDGKVVYKNKYCSYCHGERNSYRWKIIVHKASPPRCHELLHQDNLDIDTVTTKILSDCILQFIPPKNIDLLSVLCFDEYESTVIRQCNITGKWDSFDAELNDLCVNQTDTGYYIFRNLQYIYQNVHCSFCNDMYFQTVEVCENELILGKIPGRPLLTLLNANKLLGKDVSERKTGRCGNGEILDTFFNTCRTLYCLWNSLSFGGKCLPFLGYTNRLSYQLVVKLVPQTIITYSDLREDGFRNIYSHVLEKLNFIHCNMCHLALYAERFSQEMYVNFTFIPTSRCKIEDIWSKFIAAEANLPLYLNLTLNETHIAFNASWDYPDFYKEHKILLSLGMTSDCHIFTPAPGQICPKVKLLKHEVETVMKYHPRAEELRWVQNEKDINGSTFVCIYNYIPNQHSSKSLNSQSSFLVTFIITVMSWMLTTAGML